MSYLRQLTGGAMIFTGLVCGAAALENLQNYRDESVEVSERKEEGGEAILFALASISILSSGAVTISRLE